MSSPISKVGSESLEANEVECQSGLGKKARYLDERWQAMEP